MKKIRKYRYNVRVIYDDPKDCYPQAYLQYKVKFFFGLLSRWVSVNSSYYKDCYHNRLTPSQIFKNLTKEGQEYKAIKLDRRKFRKAI
jgi:hypothetical protein